MQLVGTLLGFEVQSELPTDKGRIDLIIHTTQFVYLFELKYADPEKALKQIEDRKYYERLVGLSFKRDDDTINLTCKTKPIA